MTKEFLFLQVNETDFYRMTAKQKAELKNKFFMTSMSEKNQNIAIPPNATNS